MRSELFQSWTAQMEQLNDAPEAILFSSPREVWYARLGINVGREQNGDTTTFLRPVLIMQQFGRHMLWAVPLSTKAPSIRH
ncbi:MAG TPA: hypothetical protein VMT30_05890 [Candidatus Saccharimonadia bacterium]|nr:hypothetical protein [Candidatus Saccharimonadia bacterium]